MITRDDMMGTIATEACEAIAGSLQRSVGRRKRRVIFSFDEGSVMTREKFEAIMAAQGIKLLEVETSHGTILIPDLR